MRNLSALWRTVATYVRLLPARAFSLVLSVLSLTASAAWAADPPVLENAATAVSVTDAVTQNQNELIDREVFGGTSSGPAGGGSSGGSVIGVTVGAFASGRVRRSDHDGFDVHTIVPFPSGGEEIKTFSFDTDEASVLANVVVTLPGTVLGGQLKLTGFAGYNWLSLDLKPNAIRGNEPQGLGGADNESAILGGSALWSVDGMYALATIVGFWGDTDAVDKTTRDGAGNLVVDRLTYDTSGYVGSLTAGKVFALSGPVGPMLDVRGMVVYTSNETDTFKNIFGDKLDVGFSTWTGTASTTLFANMALENNAVLRPFVQGYVRQEWDYNQKLHFTEFGSGDIGLEAFDQSHTYGGVDAGATYVFQNVTVGGSAYYEGSADEQTVGGRLGASWTFN